MGLPGPHFPGRWPSDSPERYAKRAVYFRVASYRVFADIEILEKLIRDLVPGIEMSQSEKVQAQMRTLSRRSVLALFRRAGDMLSTVDTN